MARTRVVKSYKRGWNYCFSVQMLIRMWGVGPLRWKEVDYTITDHIEFSEGKRKEAITIAKALSEEPEVIYDSATSTDI